MPPHQQVCIVGVGLLGGSIGLALRERRLAAEVVGVGRDQAKLEQAVQMGAIDWGVTDLTEGVEGADLVVICTPVETVARMSLDVIRSAPATCLVTDVASTKGAIVGDIEMASDSPVAFVGSHPLAGDHRSGAQFARGDLFEGRTVVITPTDRTPGDLKLRARSFWESLGARVMEMTPDAHDAALGVTSHLPHLVASALAQSTNIDLRDLVAMGWLDTTRIAAADAGLWRQIFAANRQPVLAALDLFAQNLKQLRLALADEDDARLEQLLAEGKRIRDAVGN